MIITAKCIMISELKNLWKLCFQDEDSYINFYYENRFKEEETLVYLANNQVVAMLTLMPGFVAYANEKLSVRYIYAVATHPEHRRKGYAAALIEYANQMRDKDYVGTFLVPASESLFYYYEALGYQTISNKKVLNTTLEDFCKEFKVFDLDHKVDKVVPLTAEAFFRFRTKAYIEAGFVLWGQEDLDYLLKEFLFLGGQALNVKIGQEEGAVLYYIDEDRIIIKETTLSDASLYAVVRYLNSQNNLKQITATLPKNSHVVGHELPFVMAYGKGFRRGEYVNLVLD